MRTVTASHSVGLDTKRVRVCSLFVSRRSGGTRGVKVDYALPRGYASEVDVAVTKAEAASLLFGKETLASGHAPLALGSIMLEPLESAGRGSEPLPSENGECICGMRRTVWL